MPLGPFALGAPRAIDARKRLSHKDCSVTEYELLRIITFLERMRGPYDRLMSAATPDANWNIVLYLMKNHLRGENVTMSSLASAAEIPFASAMRRIHKLIENGDIQLRKRGSTGKSHYLEPSRKLVISFTDYAKSVKSLLAVRHVPWEGPHRILHAFAGRPLARDLCPWWRPIAGPRRCMCRGVHGWSMSGNDDWHPGLAAERRWLGRAARGDVPVLGVPRSAATGRFARGVVSPRAREGA